MDLDEARTLLRRHLEDWRRRSCSELTRIVGRAESCTCSGASGTVYQLAVEAFWDDVPGGNVRILGSIDDGGWRAIRPLCDGFIVAPGGEFVDE